MPETIGIDYQAATLAIREWMFWIAVASLFVSAGVGGAQCWLIWRGLRTMERASAARDRQLDLAEKRHAENMRRLDEQSRRFDEQSRRFDEQSRERNRRFDEQNRRFDALIEGQADQRQALNAAVASLNAQTASLNAIVEGQAEQRRASDARTDSLKAATAGLQAVLERTAADA